MLLLIPVIVLGLRCERLDGFGRLAAITLVAVAANVVVCGVLSNLHDRYGVRIAWLAPLVTLLAALQAAAWEDVRQVSSIGPVRDLDVPTLAPIQLRDAGEIDRR
jgi:hypothetical protein